MIHLAIVGTSVIVDIFMKSIAEHENISKLSTTFGYVLGKITERYDYYGRLSQTGGHKIFAR